MQSKPRPVRESEINHGDPERGERSKERRNRAVVPGDATFSEEVIAMVEHVEPQEERGHGTSRWPEGTSEPVETGEVPQDS